jgi:hypothetical protein
LKHFFDKNFPRGYIWVTANRQAAALTGELANEYWERFLGKPAQGRLEEAAAQIAATRTFVQAAEARSGGVLIVNAAGWSLDWQSFFKLCGHYHQRFSEIDAVFPFNALPSPSATGPQIQFCGVSKKTPDPDLDFLYEKLSEALRTEIEQNTGRPLKIDHGIDINAPAAKAHFQVTPHGEVRRKRPK